MSRSDKRPCKYVVKNAQIVRKSKKIEQKSKKCFRVLDLNYAI